MKNLFLTILGVVVVLGLGAYFVLPIFGKGSNVSYTFGVPYQNKLKSDSGRINILVFGVDTRAQKYVQTGTLTDSIIVFSIDLTKKNVKMLSIPRDTWVVTNGSGSKINEVYALTDLDTFKKSVENLLSINIHYYIKVDFEAFEKIIDLLGGVDVYNEAAFTDYHYPKFGFENELCGIDLEKLKAQKEKNGEQVSEYDFPCRYETVTFAQGQLHLTGEMALKYARSRHSGNNGEGSDFARARRQQKIILGLKDKIINEKMYLNIDKIKETYGVLSSSVQTDLGLVESYEFIKHVGEINDFKIEGKVLSNTSDYANGGILVQGDNSKYGGRYVLIEKEPGIIKSFLNEYLYSETTSKSEDSNTQ